MKIAKFKKVADQIRSDAGKKDDFLLVIVPSAKEPNEVEAMVAASITRNHAIAVMQMIMQRYEISPVELLLGPVPKKILEHMREVVNSEVREALFGDNNVDLPKGKVTRKSDEKPKKAA